MMQTFIINVAEFLPNGTIVPSLYDVEVNHWFGQVVDIKFPWVAVRNIKRMDEVVAHIEAAAINNCLSLKLEAV